MTALVGRGLGSTLNSFGIGQYAWIGALVLVLLVVAAGLRGIRRMTGPMDNLIQAARRIEKCDYSARVPEYGPPEMRSVARADNAMSARLKLTDEQRRSLMADAEQELKTTITVITGQAAGKPRGLYPGAEEARRRRCARAGGGRGE